MTADATARWIGLAGPTASGKSGLALTLAERWPIEIVSVDSAQVYRGMDIGTAKPSAADRAAVPHHGIDLIDPRQAYSAAQFVVDAQRAIDEINARGKHALLVGGTMLYFKALIDGLDALPPADPAIRAALDAEAAARGWPALHAELAQVDALTAARLAPLDAQRIQRALEVWRATGRPLSSFHSARERDTDAAVIAAGLIDDVRALRSRGDLHPGLPSMRCVGYRQTWLALDEGLTGDALNSRVRETGIAATRQLAKRQLTWLRSMTSRRVVACDGHGVQADVSALVAAWWG